MSTVYVRVTRHRFWTVSAADVPDAVRLPAGVRPRNRCAENRSGAAPRDQAFPAGGQRPPDGPARRRHGGRDEATAMRHGGPPDGRSLGSAGRPVQPDTSPRTRRVVDRARTRSGVRVRTVKMAQDQSDIQVFIYFVTSTTTRRFSHRLRGPSRGSSSPLSFEPAIHFPGLHVLALV